MNRRDLFRLGVAATAVPVAHGAQAAPKAAASASGWKPAVFDEHQNETVVALTELIIPATDTPGARQAEVNRHIDRWLAAAPVEDKVEFLEGLAWLDGFSIRKHQKPFRNCSPAEQTAMLEALDAGDDPLNSAGERFFRRAKSVTAAIYYSTEIGFRELNKGNRVPSTFACRAE
jgi:hypothetical protein